MFIFFAPLYYPNFFPSYSCSVTFFSFSVLASAIYSFLSLLFFVSFSIFPVSSSANSVLLLSFQFIFLLFILCRTVSPLCLFFRKFIFILCPCFQFPSQIPFLPPEFYSDFFPFIYSPNNSLFIKRKMFFSSFKYFWIFWIVIPIFPPFFSFSIYLPTYFTHFILFFFNIFFFLFFSFFSFIQYSFYSYSIIILILPLFVSIFFFIPLYHHFLDSSFFVHSFCWYQDTFRFFQTISAFIYLLTDRSFFSFFFIFAFKIFCFRKLNNINRLPNC